MKSRMGIAGMVANGAVVAAVIAWPTAAGARPGTHGPSVATWDARASSVMATVRPGFFSGGHFFIGGFNANFSNTTGNLSAQFGMHYLNFKGASQEPTAHGVSGTAVAVLSIPLAERFENGVPKLALGLFGGGAPAALISGQLNYLTIPVVGGIGLPVSPSQIITITPWFELAPSLNLDTEIRPAAFTVPDPSTYCDSYPTPANPNAPINCPRLTQQAAADYVSQAVTLNTSFTVGARAGLDLALHITDSFAIDFGLMAGSLGAAFKGASVIWGTGSLVWHWDDIVPAVLPPERRLLKESCEDVEKRFYTCPQSEKCPLQKTQPAAPPASTTPAAPGAFSPTPSPGYPPATTAPSPTYTPTTPAPAPTYTPPGVAPTLPGVAPTTPAPAPTYPPPGVAPTPPPPKPQPQPILPYQPQPTPIPPPSAAPLPAPAPPTPAPSPPPYPMTPSAPR